MTYTPINIEEMRSKLMSVDVVKEKLAPTEGLSEYTFETDHSNNVRFDYPDDWNVGLDRDTDGLTLTSATVSIDGNTFQMTKDAATEAGSKIGIQKTYMLATPGSLITPHVNWHYRNGANGNREIKVLAGRNNAVGFTRGTVQPFSNTALLDAALEGIREKYGTDDVLVDYKFHHDLNKTKMRLIVPSQNKNISSLYATQHGEDTWCTGLEITNSLLGTSPLEIVGTRFRWVCTNGMTVTGSSSGKYRRKASESPRDAYEWAQEVVDDVFDDLERSWSIIEHLPNIQLEGEMSNTVAAIFERFRVPVNVRDRVIDALVESEDTSAYGLVNALTSVGNAGDLSEGAVSDILRIGGLVAEEFVELCPTCHKW